MNNSRRNSAAAVCAAFLVMALCSAPAASQIYTYTKSVKSLSVDGARIRVGMTHDQLIDVLRTRAFSSEADQTVLPDLSMPGSLRISRYYSARKDLRFLVHIRRTDINGPYRVVGIMLAEERK